MRKALGIAQVGVLVWLIVVAVIVLAAGKARAEEPTSSWSYGIGASVTAFAINLRTADPYLGGQAVSMGPCFDVSHKSGFGGSLCLNYQRLPDSPNSYSAGLLGRWHQLELGIGMAKPEGAAVIPLLLVAAHAGIWGSSF